MHLLKILIVSWESTQPFTELNEMIRQKAGGNPRKNYPPWMRSGVLREQHMINFRSITQTWANYRQVSLLILL
jgi:hypothetical protein